MLTLSQYIAYLESLAAKHQDILHTPEEPRFFDFYGHDDPEAACKAKIKHVPFIMLKDYDFSLRDFGADNLQKERRIEFMVVDKIGRIETDASAFDVWQRAETIGDEFMVRIRADRGQRIPAAIGFNPDGVNATPVDLGFGSFYGIAYELTLNCPRSTDPEPTKWTDLTTP